MSQTYNKSVEKTSGCPNLFPEMPKEKRKTAEQISIFRLKIYICSLKIRICNLKICIFNLKIEKISRVFYFNITGNDFYARYKRKTVPL